MQVNCRLHPNDWIRFAIKYHFFSDRILGCNGIKFGNWERLFYQYLHHNISHHSSGSNYSNSHVLNVIIIKRMGFSACKVIHLKYHTDYG